MNAVWRWVSWRRLLGERTRTPLTVLGVALGVGVWVSVRLANHSALASFTETVDAVAGRANLEVSGGGEGFDERAFLVARAVPGVTAAAPIVQVDALAAPHGGGRVAALAPGERGAWSEALLVMGCDPLLEGPFARLPAARPAAGDRAALAFLTDPRAVAITTSLAQRRGLAVGDTLQVLASGAPENLIVRWVIDSPELQHAYGGNIVLMDISAAQETFHRVGRLDRIDLIVPPARRDEVSAALARALPAGLEVGPPQGRTRQVENMVRAFDLNLSALSFIALFVATFLVFNAVALAVLRRRREIGILRSLGVTRRGVIGQFVAEGAVIGLAGSLLGLGLGTLLAKLTLGAVSRTLTDLYLVRQAEHLVLDPATYVLALGLGLAVAVVASLAPALEAASLPPATTLRQGQQLEARALPVRALALLGLGALALAAAIAAWTVDAGHALGGFVSAALVLLGFSLASPAAALALETIAGPLLRRVGGYEAALGARNLRDAVARTGAVIAALSASVGMLVALTIMVGSFRRTVDTWVSQTIRGDLYVEPVGHRLNASTTTLPSELIEQIERLPGVAAIDTYRASRITYGGRLAFTVGIDFAVQRERGRLQFVRGDTREILGRALARDEAVVTESFAHRFRVRVGDSLTVPTPRGVARLAVAGVFYDYSTDAGAILMDRHLYARLFDDTRTESFALYLAPRVSVDAVRDSLLALVGGRLALHVMPNQQLRARVLTVFDQTFQITWALQFIAVVVAVLGVISALTTLILQRGSEIGMLRAAGATRGQVRTMVLAESALLGLIGSVLGSVCGFVLALLLIHVIQRQFFGWTIRLALDPLVFVRVTVLMVVAATLAGLGPARLAAGRLPVEAMREE